MQQTEQAGPSPPPVTDGYRRYALWGLLIIYILNFLDRQIVAILAEPIRNELHLADMPLFRGWYGHRHGRRRQPCCC